MRRLWFHLAAILFLLLAGSSCGEDSSGPGQERLRLRLVSSPAPAGAPGSPLPDSVVVEVYNNSGSGVSGVPLTWRVFSPTGSVAPSADTTDDQGRASAEWILGLEQGSQSLTVTSPENEVLTLRATSSNQLARMHLQLLSSPTPSGTPGWLLSDSVVVEVVDDAGRGLSGVQLFWQTTLKTDTISPSADTTDSGGRASAGWTLDLQEGVHSLTVTAPQNQILTVDATAAALHALSVSVGRNHACALTSAGEAYCWGSNSAGQLGIPTTTPSSDIPVPVETPLRFSSVVASHSFTCGLASAGGAYCWGYNGQGQLGTGLADQGTSAPTPVSGGHSFRALSGGYPNYDVPTCGLTSTNGEVWCWGRDWYGMLGTGVFDTLAGFTSVPVRATDSSGFAGIHVGSEFACAWTPAGALSCWGTLPDSSRIYSGSVTRTPVIFASGITITAVLTGWGWGCALNNAKRVYCWGNNWFGVLPMNTFRQYAPAPVLISDLDIVGITAPFETEVFSLGSMGELYRWGSIDGHAWIGPPIPFLPALKFAQIDGGNLFLDQAIGPDKSAEACGVTFSGAVYCFHQGVNGSAFGIPVPAAGSGVDGSSAALRR